MYGNGSEVHWGPGTTAIPGQDSKVRVYTCTHLLCVEKRRSGDLHTVKLKTDKRLVLDFHNELSLRVSMLLHFELR